MKTPEIRQIAIFVEGQTEQLFVERLILEIAGRSNVSVETRRATGGSKGAPLRIHILKGARRGESARFYAMILDSTSEGRVASDVRDQYDALAKAGYSAIVGIRDVRPNFSFAQIPELRRHMGYRLKTNPIRVDFILAVMEVEAWFLGESSHIARVCVGIDFDRAAAQLGFDVRTLEPETRPAPSEDLNLVYVFGGRSYEKSRAQVQETVNALDYGLLYLNSDVRARIPSFDELVVALERFFCW